jgi:hypothetical protein
MGNGAGDFHLPLHHQFLSEPDLPVKECFHGGTDYGCSNNCNIALISLSRKSQWGPGKVFNAALAALPNNAPSGISSVSVPAVPPAPPFEEKLLKMCQMISVDSSTSVDIKAQCSEVLGMLPSQQNLGMLPNQLADSTPTTSSAADATAGHLQTPKFKEPPLVQELKIAQVLPHVLNRKQTKYQDAATSTKRQLTVKPHLCTSLPEMWLGSNNPPGCAGAVGADGSQSSAYCSGNDGQFPWWAACCIWRHTYQKWTNAACANRNELGFRYGASTTLIQAQNLCNSQPSCVSFEHATGGAGRFHFSKTCTCTGTGAPATCIARGVSNYNLVRQYKPL